MTIPLASDKRANHHANNYVGTLQAHGPPGGFPTSGPNTPFCGQASAGAACGCTSSRPISRTALSWYAGYGALALLDAPLSLVLPLAVAADALKRGGAT